MTERNGDSKGNEGECILDCKDTLSHFILRILIVKADMYLYSFFLIFYIFICLLMTPLEVMTLVLFLSCLCLALYHDLAQ